MKRKPEKRASVGLRAALAGLGLIAGLVMLQPGEVRASVSGGATIFNEATVTYTTPTIPSTTSKGSTSVTVATKANNPFVTVSQTAQTTGESSTVNYTYNIINQSNGPNTLTVTTPLTSTDNVVGAPATNSLATATWAAVWGGISLDIPVATNTINFPAGTLTGIAAGATVAVKNGLNIYYYTVTTINNGTVPTALNGGTEVQATMTVTPVGTGPALDSTIAGGTAGIIIGEYKTTVQTLNTGALPGVADGTHTINITVTATDATAATAPYTTKPAELNQTITTVKKNPITVTKVADVTSPKPGDTVTYTVTVTNNSSSDTTAAAIADPLSPYVSYNAGTTTLNGGAVADNGSAPIFPLSGAGISINSPAKGAGIVAVGATATIIYKVTVN